MLSTTTILATLFYSGLGILIFFSSFIIVDKLTPGHLWNELIERKNTALAVLAGAVAIGLSNIIAAAVHG